MTELHDIQAPVKLFRIAKLLEVSKDTIVEFLHSRGYQIANKPTAELDEQMLQLVLDKFRKDLANAEKRREKTEKVLRPTERQPVKRSRTEVPAAETVEAAIPEEPILLEAVTEEEQSPLSPAKAIPTPEGPSPFSLPEVLATEPEPSTEVPSVVPEVAPSQEQIGIAEAIASEAPTEEPAQTPVAEQPIPEISTDLPLTQPSERRREVISVTPEGTISSSPTTTGGLRIIGRISLPTEDRTLRRARSKGRATSAPTRSQVGESPHRPTRQPTQPERREEQRPRPGAPGSPKKAERTAPSIPLLPSLPGPLSPQAPPKPKSTQRRKLTLGEETVPKRRRRRILEEISQEELEEVIRQTLIGAEETGLQLRARVRQKRRAEREEKRREEEVRQSRILYTTEFLTTAELAQLLGVQASEIISKCMQLGLMVTINQRLDRDTITLIAADYGYEVHFQDVEEAGELVDEPDPPESLRPRPPIVTVMGHVDHGKTTLLDYIRQTNVVAGEAGGITQHIGAYQVTLPDGRLITFLDTPGHEAFTAMRARGAQVTDIVVLVVAADDAVMPQTVEAINHARAANVPIIVAINKIDKPEANPDRIRQQLAEHDILVEEWGGRYQSVEISALTGKNVNVLLEKILLEAELLDLRANPDRPARGTIIEAHLDKGKGPVATVIVQNGTLRIGDVFVAGLQYGRVRALYDERGNRCESAPPSTPIQVAGFDGLPEVGDKLVVVDDERLARQIALRRQQLKRQQSMQRARSITLGDLSQRISEGHIRELRLVLKADVMGSVEALTNALLRLSTDEVRVNLLHAGVGAITEADVMLAAASEAVVIGFQVQPTAAARKVAEAEGVEIRTYRIIYECLDDVKRALEGLLSPEVKEEILGHAEVRQVFHISRIGTVAGCYVTDGVIQRNARARILREGLPIHTGTIESLKRFKEDVREVAAGYECGLMVSGFEDFREGDIIETFRLVEQKRSLSV